MRLVADLGVWGDRRGDHRHAVAAEQVGDEGDATDVDVAVLLREAEALREVFAHHVAIEDLQLRTALAQLFLEQPGNCRLAGTGESGEPEGEALLACHARQSSL